MAVIGYSESTGIVIRAGRIITPSDARGKIELDVSVMPGQSGSPVLNKNGSVIGVLSGVYDNRAVATPVTRVMSMLTDFNLIPELRDHK